MLPLALAILAMSPTMAGPPVAARGSVAVPAPLFSILTSNPSSECDGAAVSGVTHTNATTTRYCELSTGGLASVGANSTRVSNKGIHVEGSRTNLIIRSEALDNAAWTATNVTVTADSADGAIGNQDAEELATTSAGGVVESTAFVPNQTSGTGSLWVAGDDSNFTIIIRDTSAGADRATCTQAAPSAALTRVTCAATGLTGANNHTMQIYPGGVAGEGAIIAWGAQFEAPTANNRTSTIPTAGTSVSRSNDNYTITNATDISAAGCMAATVTFGTAAQFGGSALSNGTEMMMGTSASTGVRINDGTNSVTATVSDLTGRTIDILTKWSGTSMTVVADGVTQSGTFDGAFSSTATLHIGRTAAGSGYCNCWVDNIRIGSHPESCN